MRCGAGRTLPLVDTDDYHHFFHRGCGQRPGAGEEVPLGKARSLVDVGGTIGLSCRRSQRYLCGRDFPIRMWSVRSTDRDT